MIKEKKEPEMEIVYDLRSKYQHLGEFASALIALDETLNKSRDQIRRVLEQVNEEW